MGDDDWYFKRNWIKWSSYLTKEYKEYKLIFLETFDNNIKINEDDVLYWDLNWKWFLSLLYGMMRDSGILRTTFDKPIVVNNNLKIWFFIS